MVRVKLVGCKYHKGSKGTQIEDIVELIKEPTNKFDKEAIAVFRNNKKIGYVATKKMVSKGNRERGCIDNQELGAIMSKKGKGTITKFRDYFGFIEVSLP